MPSHSSDITSRNASGSVSDSMASWRTIRSCEKRFSRKATFTWRETDTEILMHLISQEIARQPSGLDLLLLLQRLTRKLDGAYNLVFLNALGDMFVARDPLGIRPLCYAVHDGLFAAASESVALANLGFPTEKIVSLAPGSAVIIEQGELRVQQFVERDRRRIVSSNGSTLRTWPAPWTNAAST